MHIKKLFQITLLLSNTLVFVHTHTMDNISRNNAHIGHIDMLMLARTVAQDGYESTYKKIDAHEFETDFDDEDMPLLHKQSLPYKIKHCCALEDGSQLSIAVFDKIKELYVFDLEFECKNLLNKSDYALDHCTKWKEGRNPAEVNLTARFRNKAVFLSRLGKLRT
jgi:hypothetical protein